MPRSCSGHYLPFKIITFERSENIFDVSLHLVQKKKELFLDAEAEESPLPDRAFSRSSLQGLWTGEKQQRQWFTASQQFPHGTNLPLSTQPRDSCQGTPTMCQAPQSPASPAPEAQHQALPWTCVTQSWSCPSSPLHGYSLKTLPCGVFTELCRLILLSDLYKYY